MPSHMPPSFASAAAGQASSRDTRNGRSDGQGRGSGDWTRRENRSINGTLTLRRSSTTPFAQPSSQGDAPLPTETPGTQQPTPSNSQSTDLRYSKTQLLDIYRTTRETGALGNDISHLYMGGWDPSQTNGTNGRTGWGKSADSRDNYAADVAWVHNGSVQPIGLEEFTEEEKLAFSTDVNSPIKLPIQNTNNQSNTQGIANGRKTSVSHGQSPGTFGLSSPASSRSGTRRQLTADSITGLASPSGTGRFSREEMSPFFNRKFNEPKEGAEERPEESKSTLPLGGLMRSNTAGTTLGNGPASPWAPTSATATISPMGNFGNFALGGSSVNPPTPIDKRPPFGRGESRLTHLMPKENSEDMSKAADKPWRPRQRTDTDPFADEPLTGTAPPVAGGHNSPAPQRQTSGHDTPIRGMSSDFGMSEMSGFRDASQRAQQTPQGQHDEQDQFSPSNTNPYGSPPEDRLNTDEVSYDGDTLQHSRVQGLGGIPEHGSTPLGSFQRGFPSAPFEGSDRSQTSSAGASRGFPQLSGLSSIGLGGMGGGWPTSANAAGTPDRENRPGFSGAFGNSLFGSMGELQSPGLGGLGGVFGQSTGNISGSNTLGRGSKLGSLFPAAMQAQMQGNEGEISGEGGDMRQNNAFGAIGRNTFTPSHETDSPLRTGRHPFEDLFPQTENSRGQGPFSTSDLNQGQTVTAFPQATSAQSNYQQSQASSDSASNQLPTAQQRTMVMPDRMRWVYLDPQGQVQGPWSGLEMHDWYKASFFTADLSVKKVEDADFEPLGQLIRRIGNSREPFLVPQIGIQHGAPTTQPGAPFASATAGPGGATAQPGSVQPPFAGAFPSFGTTLTAEQQNNLERRKQEEQFLMARQREFLAQQQVNMKQMQMGGVPSVLHHHSSAHSLQSQPSFGSMTSPIGMPLQASIQGVSGFFDGPPRQIPNPAAGGMQDFFRGEDLARLNLQDRFNAAPLQQPTQAQLVQQLFGNGQETQRPAAIYEDEQTPGVNPRLDQFIQLREEIDLEEAAKAAADVSANVSGEPIGPPQHIQEQQDLYQELPQPELPTEELVPEPKVPEVLSLTQQVQKAASAKHSPAAQTQPESPWAKVNTSLPMPFPPPPQSTTPLPAPTAQRGRSHLPEALNVESRSRSETPEVTVATPSLAPWAKEQIEAPKGPSLKEIQEAEAKKAAKAEELAAVARRAALEQERKMLAAQPAAPLPGLPTTSTWGSSASPATPVSASPWAKTNASKPQATHGNASSKKTLADIQREEEIRKQKLAAAHAATAQPAAPTTAGKRYADLASKSTASGGSAWSTVGAGGKVRVPTGPAAAAPQTMRSASSATIPTASNARITRPTLAIRSVTTTVAGPSGNAAMSEFNKWAKAELKKGLNSDIDVDEFLTTLAQFPNEPTIIADSVYSASQLMDGRRFAEEFLRRRKQAEKGVVEPANTGSSSAGGWSEVAKKGPVPKEEPVNANFKVVPNKKKGKK